MKKNKTSIIRGVMLLTVCAGTTAVLADVRTDADAAAAMARATLVDLKYAGEQGGASELDYAGAATLLSYAHALAPKDEQILRLLIEAEASAGSRERLMELTSKLVTLVPGDTVALLRLASGKISGLQTVDERLDAYANFLGPKGAKIAAPVRSRLAIDGALLRRERGDLDGFAEWITLATQLDSTNKEAATLALNFYDQRVGEQAREADPMARLELLQNMLLADPLDESTHLAIAYELADAGDAKGARSFFELYGTLMAKRRLEIEPAIQAVMQVNMWQRLGAQQLIETLREQVEQQRRSVQRQRQAILDAQGEGEAVDPAELPDPAQVRLPLELERVRLAAAVSLNEDGSRREAVEYAFSELRTSITTGLDTLRKRLEMPESELPEGTPPLTEEQRTQIEQQIRMLSGELAWARVLSGRELDEARQDLQRLAAEPDADPAVLERMEGWLSLRAGDLARAQTLLTNDAADSADGGDDLRELGLALLAEKRQENASALEQYQKIAQTLPGTSVGAFARTRYAALAGREVPDAAGVDKLRKAAAAMPQWVKAMAEAPERFMSLSVQMDRTSFDPFDKASMTVTVRNTSPIPLAVGPDRTIQSRVLLVPTMQVGLNEIPSGSALEVVNLDRRLMLNPGESMTSVAWPDSGTLGWMIDELAVGTVRIRWRVLQGFEMGQDGYFVAAPISLTAESPWVTRICSPKAQAPADALITAIKQGSVREMGEALQIIAARVVRRPTQPDILPELQETEVWAALIERWKTLDTAGKVIALSAMPTIGDAPASAVVDEAIKDETDPAVLAMMLLTRVATVESPLLVEDRFTDREDLRLLADACRQQLESDIPTYSRITSPFAPQPAAGNRGGGGGGGGIFR